MRSEQQLLGIFVHLCFLTNIGNFLLKLNNLSETDKLLVTIPHIAG